MACAEMGYDVMPCDMQTKAVVTMQALYRKRQSSRILEKMKLKVRRSVGRSVGRSGGRTHKLT